jgi:cbb3-type cytochrome oxidase cytochrome c subunit
VSECHIGSIFGYGHKFVPRYDRVIDWDMIQRMGGIKRLTGALEDVCGRDVYVRDVCVRCGATVERQCPGESV